MTVIRPSEALLLVDIASASELIKPTTERRPSVYGHPSSAIGLTTLNSTFWLSCSRSHLPVCPTSSCWAARAPAFVRVVRFQRATMRAHTPAPVVAAFLRAGLTGASTLRSDIRLKWPRSAGGRLSQNHTTAGL